MLKLISKHSLYSLLLLTAMTIFACKKDVSEIEKSTDKWVSRKIADSTGNQYFIAATLKNKLEIRVENNKGELIFSKECPTIDSIEIPLSTEKVAIALTPPNRFISKSDASLSIFLIKKQEDDQREYVQLLANLNLETKVLYTKKYKVENPLDWSFAMFYDGVVQWYQNTLLVREGIDRDVHGGGGFMGLGSRGTQLVCYERDFSVRYTKDIDVTAAYYPRAGGHIIPINNNEYMGFDMDGRFGRLAILVSSADQWAGVKPTVWELTLKKVHGLPQDYQVKITDYNVKGDLVTTDYSIYSEAGKLVSKESKVWDLQTGTPRTRITP
jgi:hypothetical protein